MSHALSAAGAGRRGRFLAALMMTTTALAVVPGLPVFAQSASPATVQPGVRGFDIPAQPLADALIQFGHQAGLQATAETSLVQNLRSAPVKGVMTWQQALTTLLSGSGLAYRLNGSMVSVEKLSATGGPNTIQLGPVRVEGQGEDAWGPVNGIVATRSATGTKTDTPLRETPASISVVTRKEIEEKGSQSVMDAVRGTPSVITETAGADVRYDSMMVRGFVPDTYLNGLLLPSGYSGTGHGIPNIEPYGLERIEVLRGSAGALYGQVPAGGILNLISKRPTETPFHEIQLQTGSPARGEVAFDVGGPVTKDGTLLYRLTGLGRLADMPVDGQHDKRLYIAPSFTWRPTADTSFTFLSSYQKVDDGAASHFLPVYGSLWPSVNGYIPPNRYLGEAGSNGFTREAATIGYELKHRFNEAVSFKQNLQYAFANTDNPGITPRGWVNSAQILMSRSDQEFTNSGKTFSVDNQLNIKADTGPLTHNILAGVDYRRFQNDYLLRFTTNTPPAINAWAPVYNGFSPLGWRTTSDSRQVLAQVGIYLQDQIRFDKWLLTLSGRQDWVSTDTYNRLTYVATDRNDGAFSGRIGLNYLFDSGWSPYVSYSNSYYPVIGTNSAGEPFEPSRARQVEAGIKYQPGGTPIYAALSAFDVTRTNITTTDPNNPFFQVQSGEARIRGIEFEVKAKLFDKLDVTGAYTYSESEVTKSNNTTTFQGVAYSWLGKQLPFTPKHQASIWANYTFDEGTSPGGLSLGAGVRYLGDLYGDGANLFATPASTQFDLAASYDFGIKNPRLTGVNLRVNVTNVTDDRRVTCTGETGCLYGTGRTAIATMIYRW
ncbi:MAG: TonB-dependent siderophore receptor [Proteobacteria bacterium]|nr:TonB-dependent siderophore receptor [Pseudomonadota bacterium]